MVIWNNERQICLLIDLVTTKLTIKVLFNKFIKNGGYVFLIRLDLMFSMSLWKEFQLLQILNNLSFKHLIKLIIVHRGV